MIAQYTATALVSENKTLAHPDSVDSIPTCEDQEDHVSMSPNAARHARQIIWNVQQIVGIEMLCAAQALDFRLEGEEYVQYCDGGAIRKGWQKAQSDAPPVLGVGTRAAYDYLRTLVEHRRRDRVLYPDMARVAHEVSSGRIVRAVEAAVAGSLP
jgi:histidine ammonia-lyase